jgi:hypothetical protein
MKYINSSHERSTAAARNAAFNANQLAGFYPGALQWFEANKRGLAISFLQELDHTIINNQPTQLNGRIGDVPIVWSNKLRTTAGLVRYPTGHYLPLFPRY